MIENSTDIQSMSTLQKVLNRKSFSRSSESEGGDIVGQFSPGGTDLAEGFPTNFAPRTRDAAADPPLGGIFKRVIDIVLASMILALLAPIMLVVSVLVRLLMGGPVCFAHERIGFDGKVFTCYKFRTMVLGAEQVLPLHLIADPQAAQEWQGTRKLLNDPRVTWLGKVLRKSSLDELPQLLNVLRGDMSLVGPRPVVADELRYYGRHVGCYLKARPGLTGIWQISGRNRLSYADRVARDCHYVRNWSLAVDLAVLIKTIPAILKFSETA